MTQPPTGADRTSPAAAEEPWPAFLRDWAAVADYPAVVRLGRRAEALAAAPAIAARLTPVRLAVVSSATVGFLLPGLKAALVACGLRPILHVEPYGQVAASLLDPDGALAAFRPQVTVVASAAAHLPPPPPDAALAEVQDRVDEVCRLILDPCAAFHERTGSDLVLDTFAPLPWRPAGHFGAKLPADGIRFLTRVNLALGDRAPRGVHLHDVADLAARRGSGRWFDERDWFLAKQPIAFDCVADYCRSLAPVIAAVLGRTRKCLVADLDNTLWGGVIGDDGLAGIDVGEGSPAGEAFLAFQRYLKALEARGVLLAVCSKNDDQVARLPFREHPDMALRLEDFVAFRANWAPKSENLRAMARELNLGLDAFVFVDDNPAERHEVARALPEVAVPALPEDPAGFVRALDEARLFEITALTTEDLARTDAYRARRETIEALTSATDVSAYLASLEMRASVRPFDEASFERITQLVNKTNQFNLTTPRLVQAEIRRLAADRTAFTRSVRLRDRFADHGLISVLFGHVDGARLVLDAWLMSCRVLGRGVEQHLVNPVLAGARDRGVEVIVGIYEPTDRNSLVRHHYANLGFARADEVDGVERWQLAVRDASPFDTFIAGDDGVEP